MQTPDDLIALLKDRKQRRQEKIRHLKLDHQPIIYEITVAEKEEIRDRIDAAESPEERDKVVMETVIRSMCGWDGDDAANVTDDHINGLKEVYSADVILEIYRCIVDFSYLDEKGINGAKKS